MNNSPSETVVDVLDELEILADNAYEISKYFWQIFAIRDPLFYFHHSSR
jgi:hypothetical protein